MALVPPQAKIFAAAYKKAAGQASFTRKPPSALLYLGLAMIAFFKDLLDLAGLGSLPGVGTVVTACFAFLIWILMVMFDGSGGRLKNKLARSLVLMGFSLVEGLGFGLNFLPLETGTVVILYVMARSAWKKESERQAKEEQARNQANQAQAYRLQAQVAEATRLERESLAGAGS